MFHAVKLLQAADTCNSVPSVFGVGSLDVAGRYQCRSVLRGATAPYSS